MLTINETMRAEIGELAARFGSQRSALLPALEELQQRHGTITPGEMQALADELGLHPVEVQGVVSFYAFLREEPRGRYPFRLCRTISCEMAGKAEVARVLEEELGLRFGESAGDGRFSLGWTNCIGMCDQGPALLVGSRVHTRLTPERVRELVAEYVREAAAEDH